MRQTSSRDTKIMNKRQLLSLIASLQFLQQKPIQNRYYLVTQVSMPSQTNVPNFSLKKCSTKQSKTSTKKKPKSKRKFPRI